ncbi:hypothetical protein D046_4841B, partial [Vibrio parahaemolyticus V-223/04]
CLKNGKAN